MLIAREQRSNTPSMGKRQCIGAERGDWFFCIAGSVSTIDMYLLFSWSLEVVRELGVSARARSALLETCEHDMQALGFGKRGLRPIPQEEKSLCYSYGQVSLHPGWF